MGDKEGGEVMISGEVLPLLVPHITHFTVLGQFSYVQALQVHFIFAYFEYDLLISLLDEHFAAFGDPGVTSLAGVVLPDLELSPK